MANTERTIEAAETKTRDRDAAFRLFVIGASADHIADLVDVTAKTVEKWSADFGWVEKRRQLIESHFLRIGKNVLKEQEKVKGIEKDFADRLLSAASVALSNLDMRPYTDNRGIRHPTTTEVRDLLALGKDLARISASLPMTTVEMTVQHDLAEEFKFAIEKVYGAAKPKEIENAPIEAETVA
jgi:hypothetical protein